VTVLNKVKKTQQTPSINVLLFNLTSAVTFTMVEMHWFILAAGRSLNFVSS